MHFDNKTNNYKLYYVIYKKYYNKCKRFKFYLNWQDLEFDHSLSFILIISCLTKNNTQLKHIIIKAIQCTLLIYVCVASPAWL